MPPVATTNACPIESTTRIAEASSIERTFPMARNPGSSSWNTSTSATRPTAAARSAHSAGSRNAAMPVRCAVRVLVISAVPVILPLSPRRERVVVGRGRLGGGVDRLLHVVLRHELDRRVDLLRELCASGRGGAGVHAELADHVRVLRDGGGQLPVRDGGEGVRVAVDADHGDVPGPARV